MFADFQVKLHHIAALRIADHGLTVRVFNDAHVFGVFEVFHNLGRVDLLEQVCHSIVFIPSSGPFAEAV